MTDEVFSQLVREGIDAIPEHFGKLVDNVVITIEAVARPEQLNEVPIARGHTLLGLYQGVPQTRRGPNYSMVLPDKITIFKEPIVALGNTPEGIRKIVTDTVWHEVAHHFGLDDDAINAAQKRRHAAL
ncbi:MAG: metallopeptidase family protein [Patescibacteria group bacterium]